MLSLPARAAIRIKNSQRLWTRSLSSWLKRGLLGAIPQVSQMSDSQSAWGDAQTRYFFELTPDRVLEAVGALGLRCSGRCTALNSFENRVYEIELEEDESD